MKRTFFYLVGLQILFFASAEAQTWQYTNGPYTDSADTAKVNDVVAFSKLKDTCLFAASEAHGLFRTYDAGNHWQNVWSSPTDSITCIASRGNSVVIGTRHGLAHSGDGGDHFDSLFSWQITPWVSNLVVDTNGIFYAAVGLGNGGAMQQAYHESTDSGKTWEFFSCPTGLAIESLAVDSNNQLLFIGYPPPNDPSFVSMELWKSRDSATTWTQTQAPYYLEDGYWYAAAPNGDFYAYTTEIGLLRANDSTYDLWDPIPGPARSVLGYLHNFAFLSDNQFCATSYDTIYLTTDRANTWKSIAGPYTEFPTCEFAFNGDLFATSNAGVIRMDFNQSEVTTTVPSQYSSNFYYASGSLFLKLPEPSPVQIELFDEAGREITSFPERFAGLGEMQFSVPKTLHAGVFFASCSSSSGYLTCKFVIEQ